MPLGIEDASQGCQDSNPTCNAAQLRADNIINAFEPRLVDPDGGDFRPVAGGNVFSVTTYPIPDFGWDNLPMLPVLPPSDLNNQILLDPDGRPRPWPGIPGAYGAGVVPLTSLRRAPPHHWQAGAR